MLLSQSRSVAKRRKDQKLRNKSKVKKKHKRLDAICENAYNRSRRAVGEVEQVEFNNGGDQLELRRSSRTRKVPVLLDSSPLPPKKRRKVDRGVPSSVEKVQRESKGQSKTPFSGSRDLDGENGVWGSRLRARGKSIGFSGRERGESSVKGKRKLYNDSDDYGNGLDPQSYDKKEGLAGGKSTVVKSKRPGRIKASNILPNGNLEIDLNGEAEDDSESRDEELDVTDELDGTDSDINLEYGKESKAEDVDVDVDVASQSCEKEETAIQRNSDLDEFHSNGDVELLIEHGRPEKLISELVADKLNSAEVNCAIGDDQQQDEHPHWSLNDEEVLKKSDDQQDEHPYMHLEDEALKKSVDQQDEHPHMPLEDEALKKSDKKYSAFAFADRKPRIKLGRRCGLCGGGTDGKLPKILALEGPGSDNDTYSGSSASEEPNYDVWDGFGDQSGWLGRLLGPINDRFGIAGIWVHQQCAVWSPEVYFAGLGCLKNVRAALYRGRVLKCSRCRRPGATIGCRVDRCPKTYHLPCARAKGCIFDHRKFLIVCTDHRHLFQPHGIQNALRLKKMKTKKLKLELRKMANDASRKDVEAEEKWLENCGEDEEFLKRESKRLQRDLWRIAPTYIGGANDEHGSQFQGWESVAGLQDVIQCMKEVVILPLLYPEFFNNLGIPPPRGVLLHGHPGTGKTLVVRALVGSCARGDKRIAYFARKGADCLGKYVGDAERQLRLLFQVAEKSQPSIIFFDEIDGLAPCRSKRQDQTHNSVVSTLLALMDGLKSRGSVVVIGATNRPDAVDPALRRPGRFDREVHFPLPSVKDRESILSLHTQNWPKPLAGSLLKWVANQTVGFAGADLQALCTQAAMIALTRSFPLQEALHATETRLAKRKPALPTFSVEERDWLKALLCAPPPCSRRESGVALNDVVSSPLNLHLVPCLLQPLTRLLIRFHLDEGVWVPPHLSKVSTMVKDVVVSCLDCQRVQSDNWWLHINGLLEEVNVMNEIEKKLMLANVLVGESNLSDFDAINKNTDEDLSDTAPSSSHSMCTRPGLLKKMSHELCNKSGFQLLICGNPRSGQRHLASCLLHFFVGNVDVWKVDLASISNEGHGDMVHGLTRILMGCAQTNFGMLYLPAIDLWAIEMDDEAPEDRNPSSTKPQFSGQISCDMLSEVDMEHGVSRSAEEEPTQMESVALRKASYLWTSFVELVESMHVNSSLMVLATSELPFSMLPSSIRQFFGNEIVNSGLSSPRNRKVPQFSLQLDGKFDHDKVINCFAAKLSKDLTQQFVQSLHGGNHIHESSFEIKTYNMVDSNVDQVCNSEGVQTSPSIPVGLTSKTMKVKSSLLLAISAVGHQFLSYPHFAELCWVTSKLKDGPSADVSGPWKGWPFNSCIVRPSNSSEKVSDAFGSSNVKQKESGLVRGLVAVGLAAYRGKYTSLREVCSEVREVLEYLVGRINQKVEAGKDKSRFIRLLSQVAYLDDMIISWAHTLQSLEADARISEVNPNTCNGLFGNHVSKDSYLEGNVNSNLPQSELLEKNSQEVDANVARQFDPTDGVNGYPDAGDKIASTVDEPSNQEKAPLEVDANGDGCSDPTKGGNGCQDADEVIFECPKTERCSTSIKLSNGFTERSSNIEPDGPLSLGDKHVLEHLPSAETSNQPNGISKDTNATILSEDPDDGSGAHDMNNGTKTHSPRPRSVDICFYQCCSGCFANLHNLLLSRIKMEWECQRSDSTVEDVHDFVASLSSHLHSSLHKLFQDGNCCDHRKTHNCRQSLEQKKSLPESEISEKLLTKECTCHGTSQKASCDGQHASRFIFKDGVLSTLEKGIDISYHCKFEKLCLESLIEWLVMRKEVS